MYVADTIAAIATAAGPAGVGIVRLSGPLVGTIAAEVFRAQTPPRWQSHQLYHGTICDALGRPLDEGLAVMMIGPHSYTGEDVLELHCHGSPVGLRSVLRAVLALGSRLAEPGEFTKRAFLNGRLDLAQAEAVADLIRARTDAGAAAATGQLLGRLSDELTDLRNQLVDVRARLEVQIDFSEDDVTIDLTQLQRDVAAVRLRAAALVKSYSRGALVREGLRVAIVGKPNVGKSSLLNALLCQERAIVTAAPGTTRDVVEELADFHGIPVVLSDTAGLRDSTDPVETIGVARTHGTLARADVIVALFDRSRPIDREDEAVVEVVSSGRVVVGLNKSDLPAHDDEAARLAMRQLEECPVVHLSAQTGTGLDDLRRVVAELVAHDCEVRENVPMVTIARHRDALEKAIESLDFAAAGLEQRVPPELIAVDIQNASDHIGAITGAITSEDVLDRIFSEFCIGK